MFWIALKRGRCMLGAILHVAHNSMHCYVTLPVMMMVVMMMTMMMVMMMMMMVVVDAVLPNGWSCLTAGRLHTSFPEATSLNQLNQPLSIQLPRVIEWGVGVNDSREFELLIGCHWHIGGGGMLIG